MSEHVIWKTRDGREVRIVCTDKPGSYPIIGYYVDSSNYVEAWLADGRFLDYTEHRSDLIVPEGVTIGESND